MSDEKEKKHDKDGKISRGVKKKTPRRKKKHYA